MVVRLINTPPISPLIFRFSRTSIKEFESSVKVKSENMAERKIFHTFIKNTPNEKTRVILNIFTAPRRFPPRMNTAVRIYTQTICSFCVQAKSLLKKKGIVFEEINLDLHEPKKRQQLVEETGMRTLPQIFINQIFVGGFRELAELDAKGALDHLTKSKDKS